LGILISYIAPFKKPVMGFANVVQAIPSIALLGFLVPFLGIGEKPAVFMVVIYSLLPIIKNTAIGLSSINTEMIEAANGIGMTQFQVLTKVKLPLALPVIMAGIRISAVTSVGLVTLAAFIGANGLGYLIYSGIRTINTNQILAGAAPACFLALFVDFAASLVEKAVTPVCFRAKK
jgi:osmoprotectant transport system permease protein